MKKIALIGDFPVNRITGPKNSVSKLSLSLASKFIVSVYNLRYPSFSYNRVFFKRFSFSSIFNHDIFVFSNFYNYKVFIILSILLLLRKKVIISPRGAFSTMLPRHYLRIFYLHLFRYLFLRHVSRHYLCSGEKNNSFYSHNYHNSFISTNSIETFSTSINKCFKPLTVGFLGRYDLHHKGIDILLNYILNSSYFLRSNNIVFKLHGADNNDSLSFISKFIIENNLKDLVTVSHPLEGSEKINFFHSIGLFVHLSRYEGQPQAVLEALSHGVPVLISDGTNLSNEVESNGIGYRISSLNSFQNSLLNFVQLSLDQKILLSKSAHDYAVQNFSTTAMLNSFYEGINN